MFRSLVSIRPVSIFRRSLSATAGNPNNTSLILTGLSTATTESTLSNALSSLQSIRKVEIEPGCTIQFLNQCEADVSSNVIQSSLKYKTEIASATVPSLFLKNIPLSTTVESVFSAFQAQRPKNVIFNGGLSVEIVVVDAAAALRAAKALEGISVENQKVKTKIVKLADSRYSIRAYNFPNSMSASNAETAVLKELSNDQTLKILSLNATEASKTMKIRLSGEDINSMDRVAKTLTDAGITVTSKNIHLKKPTVSIRNLGYMTDKEVKDLFAGFKFATIDIIRKSPDIVQTVQVYFNSEKDALNCFTNLKGVTVNETKLNVSYKEMSEPGIILSHLPKDIGRGEIEQFLGVIKYTDIKLDDDVDSEFRTAIIRVVGAQEAKLAANALNRKVIRNRRITCATHDINDIEISVAIPKESSVDDKKISDLLNGIVTPKSMVHETNYSAFVDFLTLKEAEAAEHNFVNGTAKPIPEAVDGQSGGVVASSLTVSPAYILQVVGLPADSPASSVVDAILADKSSEGVNILKVDRNALVKVKRSKDSVSVMQDIKKMKIDNQSVTVNRYNPLASVGDTAYDTTDSSANSFDQYFLKGVLKDFMSADPATRYEIARNAFDRNLTDLKALGDVEFLLNDKASPALKAEGTQLIATIKEQPQDSPEYIHATKRLFELFLQKDEMRRFSHDFRSIEAFLGPPNDDDHFDWSKFQLETEEDIVRLKHETKRLQERNAQAMLEKLKGKDHRDYTEFTEKMTKPYVDPLKTVSDEDEIPVDDKGTVVSLLNPSRLRDRDGNIWSGVILNTDVVQKTTPGNRLLRHRALVFIGNMRGSGGYGKGKGKTPADALNSAFRSALNNLIHLDLYENQVLAHDVHGKHNSCHCYIRTTPAARIMVGSDFACEVLTRLGVVSASVKLVGRRDPYSMIMALVNALSKHENIDEFAKDRGKRYLTLKWGYNNKV